MSTVEELTEKLKLANSGKSLFLKKNINPSNKNNENNTENVITKILQEEGFVEQIPIETNEIPKIGNFIFQPNGTQSFPDFRVKDVFDTLIEIEVKSGKTVMLNSGLFKRNAFYMCEYSNGVAHRGYGKDIIMPVVFSTMELQRQEFEEINNKQAALKRAKNSGKYTQEELTALEDYNLILYGRAMTTGIASTSKIWIINNNNN